MKNIFRSLLGVIILLFLYLYFGPYHFLLIAANKAFETGRDSAFLDDYAYFDNREVKAANEPQPWPKHSQYNTLELSEKITGIHEKYGSVAFLVIHQDSLLYESYYNGYAEDSKSNSFSMAKSFVSALLGKAIEEGKIQSLDQKVGDFLPAFNDGYAADLTVGDLSSMASGLYWN